MCKRFLSSSINPHTLSRFLYNSAPFTGPVGDSNFKTVPPTYSTQVYPTPNSMPRVRLRVLLIPLSHLPSSTSASDSRPSLTELTGYTLGPSTASANFPPTKAYYEDYTVEQQ